MTSNFDKCDNKDKNLTKDCDNDFDSKSWITITTITYQLELNDMYSELKPSQWTVVCSVWTCILYLIDVGTDVWITSKFLIKGQYT